MEELENCEFQAKRWKFSDMRYGMAFGITSLSPMAAGGWAEFLF
jgi:hypothetical protein